MFLDTERANGMRNGMMKIISEALLSSGVPLPLIAVIDQVHAGVDIRILHLCVIGHAGTPFAGVVADEVIALAGQFFEARHLRVAFAPTSRMRRTASLRVWRGTQAGDAGRAMFSSVAALAPVPLHCR
jgi:hypothetical protein